MSSCSQCGAPAPDHFTPQGDLICKGCFYGKQTAILEARAAEHTAADPVGSALQNASQGSPARQMLLGGLVMLASLLAAAGVVFLSGDLYGFFGVLFLAGFTLFARGFAQRSAG